MPTNNHNFSLPDEGQTPWTQDWHDNFDAIDTLLRGMSADGTDWSGESVNTTEAQTTYQPNAGLTPFANRNLQSQSRTATPIFSREGISNPVFSPADMTWSGSEIHWPCIFNTAPLPNPLGEWYLYYAPHDTDGAGVAYADDLDGPWTDWDGNPIAPTANLHGEMDVFWHEEHQEVWAYINGDNSDEYLYRSPNGLTDWDAGVMTYEWPMGHVGYPRVFRTPRGVYNTTFQKPYEDKSSPVMRYSPDGITDWQWVDPDFGGDLPTGTGEEGGIFNHDGYNLIPWLNGYLAFWRRTNNVSGQHDIRYGWTEDGVTIQDWGVALAGDSQATTPEPVWDGDTLYLFHTITQDVSPRRVIGLAKADFSEIR